MSVNSVPFLELSFELGPLEPAAAEAACFASGAIAVTFADTRDDPILEPLPGEFRLWPATRLQALFAAGADADAVALGLASMLGVPRGDIRSRLIADRAWEREWLKDFHAMRFGERLWVCPRHEEVSDSHAIIVRLDPGLAFGTGTHPTTALCLEWLERHLEVDAQVIDFGCGSGILAVAAAKLGAQAAHCFDIDPQALTATLDNAAENGVAGRVRVYESQENLPSGVDVLLANILSRPLCALAPRFAALVRPGGALVLAGLMTHELPEVAHAQGPWFDMRPFASRDEWVGLSGRRRPP
jgi:ribosomal protein L11 methyltransferase